MLFLRQLAAVLLMLIALDSGGAAPVVLSSQVITLPSNASQPLFVDTGGNDRSDMFVIDRGANQLLVYRQRPDGFANTPDQLVPLPAHTGWVALGDVDPHPGLELLISTATGLVYFRQEAGRFESESRPLITASQVFTNGDFSDLVSLSTNETETNFSIPVIDAGQTVQYHRNAAYEWSPAPPVRFDSNVTAWYVHRDQWNMGQNVSRTLHVQRTFRSGPKLTDEILEKGAVNKIIEDMKNTEAAWPPGTSSVDADGDGRPDLVLWQTSGRLDYKTDLYLFLRGTDGQLPRLPPPVLRFHGFPIPVNPLGHATPLIDLKGDGRKELVLLELKTTILSADGLMQTILSHGLDWALTIRSFQQGTFSRNPEASVPVTMALPAEVLYGWPICIQGDFNGDGRPDLFVRRSDTQWNIFFSTTDGRWFDPRPAMSFEAPAEGYMAIQDLNGDRLSDIIWFEPQKHQLSIFRSPSRTMKGNNP